MKKMEIDFVETSSSISRDRASVDEANFPGSSVTARDTANGQHR